MPNITINLDEETHRLAKIYSAQNGTSLSKLFRDYIRTASSFNALDVEEVLRQYSTGELRRSEAMQAIGLEAVDLQKFNELMEERGIPFPRIERNQAEKQGEIVCSIIQGERE